MIQRWLGDWGSSMAAICQWVGGVSNLWRNSRVNVWSWCLQVERRNAIKDTTKKHCFSFEMQTCLPTWCYYELLCNRNRWFVAEIICIHPLAHFVFKMHSCKGGQITRPPQGFPYTVVSLPHVCRPSDVLWDIAMTTMTTTKCVAGKHGAARRWNASWTFGSVNTTLDTRTNLWGTTRGGKRGEGLRTLCRSVAETHKGKRLFYLYWQAIFGCLLAGGTYQGWLFQLLGSLYCHSKQLLPGHK